MLNSPFALAIGAVLSCAAATAPGGDGWTDDFAAAKVRAAKEGKDLLVDFTGSDWCHWCIKLSEEVFEHEAFEKEASKDFVFVELDFPRRKQLAPEVKEQNAALQAKFGIQGFPTVLLMDAQGRPYAQTGYQPGGPEKYLAHLDELRRNKAARDRAFAAAAELKGSERAKKLAEGIGHVPPNLVVPGYGDLIAQIIELDADDSAGLRSKFQHKLGMFKLLADLREKIDATEWGAAVAVVDAYLAEHDPKGETRQEILAHKINPLANDSDWDQALKVLSEIEEIDADNRFGKWAAGTRKRIAELKRSAGKTDR